MPEIQSAAAVLVAAGKSSRMGGQKNKVLENLKHRPIISYSLESFQKNSRISIVVVVSREEDREPMNNVINLYCPKAIGHFALGGAERFESVRNGLRYLTDFHPDGVLIHDAARPMIEDRFINETLDALRDVPGCLVGVPAKDTIKEISQSGLVIRTYERSKLRLAQTPQVFRYKDILKAYEAIEPPPYPTDDAAVLEMSGGSVRMIEGSYRNMKITTPEDLILADTVLSFR